MHDTCAGLSAPRPRLSNLSSIVNEIQGTRTDERGHNVVDFHVAHTLISGPTRCLSKRRSSNFIPLNRHSFRVRVPPAYLHFFRPNLFHPLAIFFSFSDKNTFICKFEKPCCSHFAFYEAAKNVIAKIINYNRTFKRRKCSSRQIRLPLLATAKPTRSRGLFGASREMAGGASRRCIVPSSSPPPLLSLSPKRCIA